MDPIPESTVTAAEVARLAGVGRAAVSNWRRRHDDFPKPRGGTVSSPTFALSEVEEWLTAQGKLSAVPADERLWRRIEAVRGSSGADPEPLVLIGLALLSQHRGLDRGGPLDASSLLGAMESERAALGESVASAVDLPGTLQPEVAELLEGVLADQASGQRLFEELVERWLGSTSRTQTTTPEPLAGLMAELVGIDKGLVADPACGVGSLLLASTRRGEPPDVAGQDVNPLLASLAAIRLALHGVSARIAVGDSMRSPTGSASGADAVMCNPPFGERNWGAEDLAYDDRWVYGVPARGEPELAWVQHCLAQVRPGGRVVVVMPPAAASRRSGRRVRSELLRRGALRAVISLPARAASPQAYPLQLWVLRRPEPGSDLPSYVLLVDAKLGEDRRAAAATIDWPAISADILNAWHKFEESPDAVTEVPGQRRAVPVIDLLDDDVDVTPARNLPVPVRELDAAELTQTTDRLRELLGEALRLVPELRAADGSSAPRNISTVGDLARAGVLQVRHGVGRLPAVDEADSDGVVLPVLTLRDVVTGHEASGSVPAAKVDGQWPTTECGDVVVPMLGLGLVARVVIKAGLVVGPNVYLLRPDPAALEPWFLAGFLRTSGNERQTNTHASAVSRFEVRRAELPRLPIATQRAYAEAFEHLDRFEASFKQAAAVGEEVVRSVTDGLAAGLLGMEKQADDSV